MSLAEDLNNEIRQANMPGGRDYGCSACDAIANLTGADKAALIEALSGKMSERKLLMISAKHGLGIGKAGIRKHRREDHP